MRSIKQMTVQLPSAAQILSPIQNLPNVPTNLTENFNSSEAMSASVGCISKASYTYTS